MDKGEPAAGHQINGISSQNKPIWFDGSCDYYEPRVQSYSTNCTGTQIGNYLAIGYLWDALDINLPIPSSPRATRRSAA